MAVDSFMGHAGAEKGLARASLEAMQHDLARLRAWAEGEGLAGPGQVRDSHLRAFLTVTAAELAASSRARLMSTLRGFFRFLVAEGLAPHDPTATVAIPRKGRKLPVVLSVHQVTRGTGPSWRCSTVADAG